MRHVPASRLTGRPVELPADVPEPRPPFVPVLEPLPLLVPVLITPVEVPVVGGEIAVVSRQQLAPAKSRRAMDAWSTLGATVATVSGAVRPVAGYVRESDLPRVERGLDRREDRGDGRRVP